MSILGSEVGSGFGEPDGTPPPRIPRNTSRAPGGDLILLYRSEFLGGPLSSAPAPAPAQFPRLSEL